MKNRPTPRGLYRHRRKGQRRRDLREEQRLCFQGADHLRRGDGYRAGSGAAPAFGASVPEGAGYTVPQTTSGSFRNGVAWRNDTDGVYLDESSTFEEGKKYTVSVMLIPSENYVFDTAATAKINGSTAKMLTDVSALLLFTRTFTATPAVTISSLEVGVTAPYAGNSPVFSATVPAGLGYEIHTEDSGSRINGVLWSTTSGRTTTYLTEDSVFEAGKTYTASVRIKTSDGGHKLAISGLTATVNGRPASISYLRNIVSATNCYVAYSFTCTEKTVIDTVSVTITAPSAGEKPSFNAILPEGMGYMVKDYNVNYKNGVSWLDVTAGNVMITPDSSVTFEPGKHYSVIVSLVPADAGHEFAESASDLSGTVNGKAAETGVWTSKKNIYVRYVFTCPTAVSTVTVAIAPPVAGGSPSYAASVPEGMGYKAEDYNNSAYGWKNGVSWLDVTAGNVMITPDSSVTFEAGKKYTLYVSLVPTDSSYEFAANSSDLSGTVNGEAAKTGVWTAKQNIYVSYTFTCADSSVSELDAALNVSGGKLHFSSEGEYPWAVEIGDGRFCGQSGNQNIGSTTSVLVTTIDVTVAGELSFDFLARGEGKTTGFDQCVFSVDGEAKFTYGAHNEAWETYKTTLPVGRHTMIWSYTKDGSVNPTGDFFAVDNVAFTGTFTSAKAIVNSVKATIKRPISGQKPSYAPILPAGIGYMLEDYSSDGGYKDGVSWYNKTDGKSLDPETDTFEARKQYTVELSLVTASNSFEFAEKASDITASINGNGAEVVIYTAKKNILVNYTFVCISADKIITAVEITIDPPVAGEMPSYTATVPTGAGYRISSYTESSYKDGIAWAKETGGCSGSYLTPGADTFEVGVTYIVHFRLEPIGKDYTLPEDKNDMTVFVNGVSVGCDSINTSENYFSVHYNTGEVPDPSKHNLWLGETQVTDSNKDDILGDGGKAKYDPSTNTLTLNDPTITGTHTDSSYTYKIYAKDIDLTVKGSYHMTSAEAKRGIKSEANNLTLSGDFTFMTNEYAVSAAKTLTVQSGTLKAVSGEDAIISLNGTVSFGSGVTRVEMQSDTYAASGHGMELDGALAITSPEGAEIGQDPHYSNYQTILNADGTVATAAVIEKAPLNNTVTVNVTSFLDQSEKVTVQLKRESGDGQTVLTNIPFPGTNTPSTTFNKVSPGKYTLTMSKKNHVTRDYEITVSGDMTVDTKIHPIGDVSGDGKITNLDFARANSHVKGVVLLKDYELKCADVVKNDGLVTNLDAGRINSHVKGVAKLW